MAKPAYKHVEDDGDLSIFASDDVIVLACEHGEYWVIKSKAETKATVRPAMEKLLSAEKADLLYKAL